MFSLFIQNLFFCLFSCSDYLHKKKKKKKKNDKEKKRRKKNRIQSSFCLFGFVLFAYLLLLLLFTVSHPVLDATQDFRNQTALVCRDAHAKSALERIVHGLGLEFLEPLEFSQWRVLAVSRCASLVPVFFVGDNVSPQIQGDLLQRQSLVMASRGRSCLRDGFVVLHQISFSVPRIHGGRWRYVHLCHYC